MPSMSLRWQGRLPVFLLAGWCACHGPTAGEDDTMPPDDSVTPDESRNRTASNIKHVVVIVQENHTFDNHFGRYCQAPTGSNPSCHEGPACCEAAPDADPGTGMAPALLSDDENGAFNPTHSSGCELDEIHGGKMDRFISSAVCGKARNFALAASADAAAPLRPYWDHRRAS
jgi:hypothetical protein